MIKSSTDFLFHFLPVVLLLYYMAGWSRFLQNMMLFAASFLFYTWISPAFASVLIVFILFNYCMGLFLEAARKKWILCLALLGNLGTLLGYKYLNFIVETINNAVGNKKLLPLLDIAVPMGISIVTLHGISYVVDIYRNTEKAQKNPFYLGLYLIFFPKIIQGPITPYSIMTEQIRYRKETGTKFSVGCCRFIVGFSKKVLLSNQLAGLTETIFTRQEQGSVSTALAWIGAVSYMLRLYYELSAYSDMAIGLALMFGFKMNENMDYPYLSKSLTEFWRKWNISLTSWFHEYVFVPLGGRHVKNKDTVIRNLFIFWLLMGIYYGAGWTFIFFGIYHFVFLLLETILDFEENNFKPFIKHLYCLLVVMFGGLLLGIPDLIQVGNYIRAMFGFTEEGLLCASSWAIVKENCMLLVVGIIFTMPIARKGNQYLYKKKKGYQVFDVLYPIAMFTLLFICLQYATDGTYHSMIFRRFG